MRSMGWSVLSFESAEAFLVSGAASRTQCLISDVTMSGMSGVEMHALLILQRSAPPTIFITGYPTAQDRAMALANGALAYYEKPIDSNLILTTVQQVIATP